EFHCGDAMVHMAAGECWIFDTWRLHRVINPANHARVHLVVDSIGSSAFGTLVNAGRAHDQPDQGWIARRVESGGPDPGKGLMFESVNLMSPMTYWEMRGHVDFLLGECEEHPLLPVIRHCANEFVLDWRTLWFCHGTDPRALPSFRAVLDEFLSRIGRLGSGVSLRNQTQLVSAFNGLIGQSARVTSDVLAGEENTRAPRFHTAATTTHDYEFDRPVFIVSPPRSGSSLLFETLALSRDVCTIGGESHGIIEGNTASGMLGAAARGYASNRLDAADATPEVIAALRERFRKRAFDRNGASLPGRIRLLEKTPKNALRVPFLATVFPDALFIYLHRDPRQVMASMMEAWESGGFVTYPQLPGWTGLPWSMVLTPGWRELIGKPLPDVVAAQWRTVTDILLDDLEDLPADRWTTARYDQFIADPDTAIRGLCAAVGFDWDQQLPPQLPLANHTVSAPDAEKWRKREADILPRLQQVAETVDRAERSASA
ncbi:MAG: sulfotransferase, partial [Xanthomonadaceae bacterium]|nr:sulfotransferase [Xanthomonadaceae bacterium]